MKLFYIFLFFDIFFISNSLMPKKLPNGKPRIFVPNFDKPYSDLKLLSKNETSLICKNWMSNILLSVRTNKGISNTIKCDDLHIITSINKLNFDDNNKLYFGWKPLCLQGFKEVLFIVSIELDIDNKIMNVVNLVQSPFWDNKQIESIFLKNL